jgi:hypothetical protein
LRQARVGRQTRAFAAPPGIAAVTAGATALKQLLSRAGKQRQGKQPDRRKFAHGANFGSYIKSLPLASSARARLRPRVGWCKERPIENGRPPRYETMTAGGQTTWDGQSARSTPGWVRPRTGVASSQGEVAVNQLPLLFYQRDGYRDTLPRSFAGICKE